MLTYVTSSGVVVKRGGAVDGEKGGEGGGGERQRWFGTELWMVRRGYERRWLVMWS